MTNFSEKMGGGLMKIRKNKYEYLIFDFDGTLSDTYPVFTDAVLMLAERYGVKADYDTVYSLLKINIGAALKHYDLGISDREKKDEFWEIYLSIAMDRQKAYPDAKEILEFARQHGKKSYVYTHSKKWVYDLMEQMEILEYFDFVLDSTYDFPPKPAPDALNFMCEKCNIDKSKALMIGDRDIDIEVGHNAGMDACLIDEGGFYKDCKAEYRIEVLDSLKSIITAEV